jgi:hypothetical protein
MDTSAVVDVVCDRCHRPGWQLVVSNVTGDVVIDGNRIGFGLGDADPGTMAMLRRPGANRWNADPHSPGRAGAFILFASDTEGPSSYREKLVCIGRKHPRYERVVTHDRAARAYRAAVSAGRTRIGLREI